MKYSLLNHVIVIDTIGEITQELENFLVQEKAARGINQMIRFLKSYFTYSILMFCIGLLFPGIFYQMTGVWIFLWVVPGIPFVFLGCQAIIYKSDFSPGPYYGSAISAILSIALPFGAFWDWADAGGSLPLLGWVVLWVALLFYLPLAMMLGWSIGKFLTRANS